MTKQPQGTGPENQAKKTSGGAPSCPTANFPLTIQAFQAPSNARIQHVAHKVFQDTKITLTQILKDHRLYSQLDPRNPAKSNVEVGLVMIRFNPSQFLKLPQVLQSSPEIRKAAFLVALHDRNLPLLNEWNAYRVPHLQEELSQLEEFQEAIS